MLVPDPGRCLRKQSTRDVALALALARCDAAAEAAAAGSDGSLGAYEELRAAAALLEAHRVGPALLAEVHGAMEVRWAPIICGSCGRCYCVQHGGESVMIWCSRIYRCIKLDTRVNSPEATLHVLSAFEAHISRDVSVHFAETTSKKDFGVVCCRSYDLPYLLSVSCILSNANAGAVGEVGTGAAVIAIGPGWRQRAARERRSDAHGRRCGGPTAAGRGAQAADSLGAGTLQGHPAPVPATVAIDMGCHAVHQGWPLTSLRAAHRQNSNLPSWAMGSVCAAPLLRGATD